MSPQFVVFAALLSGIALRRTALGERFPRINGGTAAEIEDFPWMASIRTEGRHFCGGAIINPKTILTAAHCMLNEDLDTVDVRVGSKYLLSGGQVIAVDSVTYHPRFKNKTLENDIAIIRLVSPIVFSDNAKAVPLPKADSKTPLDQFGHVAGWGRTKPKGKKPAKDLQFLRVLVLTKKFCEDVLRRPLTKHVICAGNLEPGKITCFGDSGSPLTVNGVLVGIDSNGSGCLSPEVYTKVSSFRQWIDETLKKFNEVLQ